MWFYKDLGSDGIRKQFQAVNICEECGSEFVSKSPATTKYCEECGKQIRKEQGRERVKRFRAKQKKDQRIPEIDLSSFDITIDDFPDLTLDPLEDLELLSLEEIGIPDLTLESIIDEFNKL